MIVRVKKVHCISCGIDSDVNLQVGASESVSCPLCGGYCHVLVANMEAEQ